MRKLQKATKRIAAVAASASLVSSAAFGAGLGDYPNNFVSSGAFDGQVVVGAAADAMDSTSAASIIDDLREEFSGENEKVKITYKSSSSGGEEIKFADSGDEWNFGETNDGVRSTSFDESDDGDIFSDDETFDNGYADEDYTQDLQFTASAIVFEHALRDDQSDDISTHLYFEDQQLMSYVFELDSSMTDVGTGGTSSDFVGEDVEILGQTYTITEVSFDATKGIDKLVMIGGANKIALGEGDSTSVSIDGKTYEIEVQAVGSSEVLLSVNGVAKSIDEFDTEVVSGLNIGVTELIESSRDSVKGYAELVLGGREIELEDGQQVKINDEDIDDIFDDFSATTTFNGTGADWDSFTVTYTLDEEVLVEAGEQFDDFVFGAFSILFKGTNDVEYKNIKVHGQSDEVQVEGETVDGEDFNEKIALVVNTAAAASTDSPIVLIGESDDDTFLVEDILDNSTAAFTGTTAAFNSTYGINFTGTTFALNGGSATAAPAGGAEIELGNFNIINVSNSYFVFLNLDNADGARFLVGDNDDQYIWEVGTFTSSDDETDFSDILHSTNEDNVGSSELSSKLDDATISGATEGRAGSLTGTTPDLAFANEGILELEALDADAGYTAGTDGVIGFELDSGDVNADTEPGDVTGSAFNIDVTLDVDDDEPRFGLDATEFVLPSGAEADVSDSDDDHLEYVNVFGVKVLYTNEDDNTEVEIMVPDEQVRAEVYLVTGGAAAQTFEVTVDADDVDSKKEELENDGFSIVGTESVTSEEVDFDVTGAVLDSDVTGTDDMIVVGGPAVNSVAAELLGLSFPTFGSASGVDEGEAVIRYFEDSNSVLVYGFDGADTKAAAEKLNEGGLSGSLVNVE